MAALPLFPSLLPSNRSFVPSQSTGTSTTGRPIPIPVPPTAPTPVSPVDRTEAALREAGMGGRFWRGDALSTSPLPAIPSGFRTLDEELPGGGWPSRCLTELLLAHPGVGEIRFLATTLGALTAAGREIVLLAPPHIPDPTGWEQLGIDMRRVLVVRTSRPADRLWALEESLKSSAFGALVAWLPEDKALARHDALRRLQAAAAATNGLTFLMRPFEAQYHPSPAPLRLTLSGGTPDAHRRSLSVRLLKRRGPVLGKPLTLMLPEIHLGLKAYSGRASTPVAGSAPLAVIGRDRATTSTRPTSFGSPVGESAISPLPSHALAGTSLSDAAA